MLDGQISGEPRRGSLVSNTPSLLSNIALFQGLSLETLSGIELACRYRRFSAQEAIIDRDDQTTDVFFIVRGSVRVVNYSLSGREITFEDLHEGQFFGELAAIDGLPRAATVIALEDTLIVALAGRLFVDLILSTPKLAHRVMVRMSQVIRASMERIMDLSTLAAINRVQSELLRQAQSGKNNGNRALIDPIPIHSDIASRVSTTRETVARVLNDLARKGIVERTRDGLIIHDLKRLKSLVDEVRG